jgi:hypothetical protein
MLKAGVPVRCMKRFVVWSSNMHRQSTSAVLPLVESNGEG